MKSKWKLIGMHLDSIPDSSGVRREARIYTDGRIEFITDDELRGYEEQARQYEAMFSQDQTQ